MPTLRELRRNRALSIADLAKLARVSTRTIFEIEHALRSPHPSTRRKLAAALGVEPSEIEWPDGTETPRVTCGYCGAVVDVDHAYDHLRTHLTTTQVIVDVANFSARLARHVPEGNGRIRVEYADPQPPQHMLASAVTRVGGALNHSGIYPPSPALMRWIARVAPRWVSPEG